MASCNTFALSAFSPAPCAAIGGYTGKGWIMQWFPDQWTYGANNSTITDNFQSTIRYSFQTGQMQPVLEEDSKLQDSTGSPIFSAVLTLPLFYTGATDFDQVTKLVGSGRVQIILERNSDSGTTDSWYEVIGAASGLLFSGKFKSGKKAEDFSYFEGTFSSGGCGISNIAFIDTGDGKNADYVVVIND
jgi:hypothetical protein